MRLNTTARRDYARLRNLGWKASDALRSARVRRAFDWRDAGDTDFTGSLYSVRLRVVADEFPDLSYLDQDEFADVADSEYQRAADNGVVGIVAEYRDAESDEWQHADSVYGFIGDDWQDSGYDVDLMQSALEARLASLRKWRAMCAAAP